MIQLLYGNNGVNYAEIARSSNLSAGQYNELHRSYLGYPFAANPELYGRKEQEPVAYNILMTDLSGKLPKDMLLLSKKAKMCGYETPSYYAHLQLVDVEEEIWKKDFASLFKYDFIEEGGIKEYQNGVIEGSGREKDYGIDDQALREDQIKASLYLLYRHIGSWTKKVTIIIDEDGPGYNQRALDITASIYKYIPWSLRRLVGFTTYSTPDVKEAEQIKIRIMPRCCLGRCDEEEMLDFKRDNLMDAAAVRNVPDQIRNFVDKLWGKGRRDKWFALWWENYGNAGNVTEHLDFCDKWEMWSKGDIKEHFGEIMEYALRGKNKGKAEYTAFRKQFKSRIDQKKYSEIMLEDLGKVTEADDFYTKYNDYAALADLFPDIKLDTKYALGWFKNNPLAEALGEQDKQMSLNKLMLLLKRIKEGEEKHIPQSVKGEWIKYIKKCTDKLNKEIAEEKEREKRGIDSFINSLNYGFYITDIEEEYECIRYGDDNRRYFQKQLCSFLKARIQEDDLNFQEKDYLESRQWLQECQKIIEENDYRYLDRLSEEIKEKRRSREERLFIIWNTRDDIKKYYENRTYIHMIYGGNENTGYKLIINNEKFLLKESQMDDIAAYLLNGTEENLKKAELVFESANNLLEELEKGGFIKLGRRGLKHMFKSRGKKVKK